ncbi:hypothetical protein [Thermaerobacter subterraneus]|uniref:Uncharacterized protein n=1 Tax=Thermaerobacter subterraneus DSM 13965 TaxID=867903 RepID=K6PQ41_9FIRM|nr:hypothetical protein [Thermaerobacter subterraneus]EKP95032.1 hypothetical protein ThesuDRAFT_00758 [Thermaerobacter subterraneus DSM 13965]
MDLAVEPQVAGILAGVGLDAQTLCRLLAGAGFDPAGAGVRAVHRDRR